MIYLASPYSFPVEERERRYRQNVYALGFLIREGFKVFSPIVHSHKASEVLKQNKEEPPPEFWYEFDMHFMQMCDRLIVLQLSGWRISKGVELEISYFWNKRHIKAEFMHPAGYRIHELPWPGIE